MTARIAGSSLVNGEAVPLDSVPETSLEAFQAAILDGVEAGQRVSALFATDSFEPGNTSLLVVLANDQGSLLHCLRTRVEGSSYPSLTPRCPQVHLFEREVAEQFGLRPEGHPWLKPVRYPRSPDQTIIPGGGDFYQVQGIEIHEVTVGPVHAGVIEPGHFRFQCHGERVIHLEIALGFQHRGVERALVGGPNKRSIHYSETLAGDSTTAHTTAFCHVLEALAECQISPRAQLLRGVALELERLANHVGDLGALAGDVGFLPTSSYCGRLRGDFLNMTALLCGSRFGRGMVRPGGVGFDLDEELTETLLRRLQEAARDTEVAVELLWDSPSVMARLEGVGVLPREVARELGVVGPAARAAGLERDCRSDQPAGIFRFVHLPVSVVESGDVFARALVRWLEIKRSLEFLREQLANLPGGVCRVPLQDLAPSRLAVALGEGWRGEVCHVALTDATGKFSRYKVVDPSFHNWPGLAHALRQQAISDFPLINKSFNLSYCGHDL